MLKSGKITKFQRSFTNAASNVSQINQFDLTSGTLISVSVSDLNRTTDWGSLHVSCGITRIVPDANLNIQPDLIQLCTGYVSRSHQISYPVGTNLPILAGQGLHNTQATTTPSPGAELTFTWDSNLIRKFYGIRLKLVTSSNVATRRIHLVMRVGIRIFFETVSDTGHVASLEKAYVWFSGMNEQPLNDNVQIGSAPLITLPKNTTIETVTTNLDAGDQFSDGVILFEDFFTTD